MLTLTAQQMLALKVSERTMSALSICGSLFIMGTFIRWHYFRKPINRLVFYASFGNVMANVATLISTSALPLPHAQPSPLCEFQGVLIQWFMMADSLWVFCMALNVMLVFFYQYNSHRLRKLEKYYLAFSYGVPFVPAMAYVVADHHGKKQILGNAVLWCWIDKDWEWMRIAFFYGPVWVMVICTLLIYIVTGRTIFKRRKTLRQFSKTRTQPVPIITNPFTAATLHGIERRTEISIQYTSETTDSDLTVVAPNATITGNDSRSSFSSTRVLNNIGLSTPSTPTPSSPGRFAGILGGAKRLASTGSTTTKPDDRDVTPTPTIPATTPQPNAYTAAITASPSHPHKPTAQQQPAHLPRAAQTQPQTPRRSAIEGNKAAWSYFKVAFLMFAALFIVWVPSTVNRLQQFINTESPLFGLNLASALVLPLQGFWNAMVYVSTTWPECKRAFGEGWGGRERRNRGSRRDADREGGGKDVEGAERSEEEGEGEDVEVPLDVMLRSGPKSESRPSTRQRWKM